MPVSEEEQVKSMLEAMGVSEGGQERPSGELTETPTEAQTVETAAPNQQAQDQPGFADSAVRTGAHERKVYPSSSRDMNLSTFIHLLGLPTAAQMALLDSKVDVLMNKLTAMSLKLERLAADLSAVRGDAAVDRIDLQISEIRALLRRLVPAAAASGELKLKSQPPKVRSEKAKVLSSEPAAAQTTETKILESDALAEPPQLDDAGFQAEEGKRIRMQTKEGV
jgi:hypothetical protein